MDEKIRADWTKLSSKQKELVKHYMKTGNKTQSRIAAYGEGGGLTAFNSMHVKAVIAQIEQTAVIKANFSLDDVLNEKIDDLVEVQKDILDMQIDAAWVLKRAALLADFNIDVFIKVDDDGQAYYDFTTATSDDWYCISEYTVDTIQKGAGESKYFVEKTKLKPFDKLRALELVGKNVNVNAFQDKMILAGDEDNPIQTITRTIVKADES